MGIQARVLGALVCVTGILCSYPGHAAQDERTFSSANIGNLHATPDSGFYATNLVDMVKSADIIIEGRYGAFIRTFPFYGYDEHGADKPPKAHGFGMPVSEYEIIPSRILKGATWVSGPLVLRLTGTPGEPGLPVVAAQRSGNHLFFFALNPDRRTVGLHGGMFDMKETDTAYTFLRAGQVTTALDSDDKELFLRRLEAIIESESGAKR